MYISAKIHEKMNAIQTQVNFNIFYLYILKQMCDLCEIEILITFEFQILTSLLFNKKKLLGII